MQWDQEIPRNGSVSSAWETLCLSEPLGTSVEGCVVLLDLAWPHSP